VPRRVCIVLAAGAALLGVGVAGAQAQGTGDAPRCFGAAARDPWNQPCENPKLRATVTPTPREARDRPNAPCTFEAPQDLVLVCGFGAPEDGASRTVALVGDSHASHWRAALEVVAERNGWHGVSLTHSSCPLSKAVRKLPEPARSHCAQWKTEVFAWFRAHPEIRTVFVSGLSGGTGVVPSKGRSAFETSVAGYRAAFAALPDSVRRIVVIRDNPKDGESTASCVTRAVAAGRSAGTTCAISRAKALDADPMAEAARRMRSPRVRVADLTRYFCDPRRCFPVIGGALVHKDRTHLTAVFAASLGPFLARELRGKVGSP
jgi:hypothetical protein